LPRAVVEFVIPVGLVADLEVPSSVTNWEEAYRKIPLQSPELTAAKAIVCKKQALLTGVLDSPVDFTTGDGIRGAAFGGQQPLGQNLTNGMESN
jgi:hypothetical protein